MLYKMGVHDNNKTGKAMVTWEAEFETPPDSKGWSLVELPFSSFVPYVDGDVKNMLDRERMDLA